MMVCISLLGSIVSLTAVVDAGFVPSDPRGEVGRLTSKWRSDSTGRPSVLRRAENVTISRAPFGRVTIQVGRKQYRLKRRPTKEQWTTDRTRQQSQPVLVFSSTDRNLWQFQNRFYWDNDGLDGSQIYALLVTRGQREQQRIERTQAMVAMGSMPRQQVRGAIPDDPKQYVWRRDGGCCRHCGNQYELQYDHIIPIAMGGATTAENLQILCGPCNRRKSAGLTVR